MKILQVYLALPQLATLKKLSLKLDLSVAELVRRAIDAFLEGRKP